MFEVCVGTSNGGCQALERHRPAILAGPPAAAIEVNATAAAAAAISTRHRADHGASTAVTADTTWVWEAHGLELRCGHTYYLHVTAANCAGLLRTFQSNPLRRCCGQPVAGDVQVPEPWPATLIQAPYAQLSHMPHAQLPSSACLPS